MSGLGFFVDVKGGKFDIYRFNRYLSDIRIETEIMKTNRSHQNDGEFQEHLSEISQALSGITEMFVEYVEKSGKHHVILAENIQHAKEELVGLKLREALLEIGKPIHDRVVQALYSQYNCSLADCLEHPEYLKDILNQLFGPSHVAIIKSIKKQLYELNEHRPIQEFLMVITK
jgi:hypothetical protein